MERIAPIDIDHANLKKVVKGYDCSQVDVLLNRVKKEMADLMSELKAANDEIGRQKHVINSFMGQENTVKDTLIVAQRAAEEVRSNAHREADAVVAQAHRTAEETQRQYQAKINDLRWELERLRMDRQKFATDFRNTLEGYLRTIAEDNTMTPPLPGTPVSSSTAPTNGVVEPSETIKAAIETAV
jgi:cell division initiation protein